MATQSRVGDTQMLAVATTPFLYTLHVAPESQPGLAGIRTGDSVDLRDLPLAARVMLKLGAETGTLLQLPISRAGVHRVFAYRIPPYPSPGAVQNVISWTITWLLIAAAGVLILRRGSTREGALLAAFLLGLENPINNTSFVSPNLGLNVFCWWILSTLVQGALEVTFVSFAAGFGRQSRLRRGIEATIYALTALFVSSVILRYVGPVTLWFDAGTWPIAQNSSIALQSILLALLQVTNGALALRTSEPAARGRFAWIYGGVSVYVLFTSVTLVVFFAGAGSSQFTVALDFVGSLVMGAAVLYGCLNRRVLDIGFALNRAAVFTAVSIVLAGIFVLLEWAAGAWLGDASRTTNVVVSAGIALGLGLSTRYLHARIDRAVDAVFFRKRHENEAALLRFAKQVPYVSNLQTLRERTVATLKTHADAKRVDFWLESEGDTYTSGAGSVGGDDPALLAFKSGESPVVLQGLGSALEGDVAYALAARGHLVGALVLGGESVEHTYAPDEIETLGRLAQALGNAVDTLITRSSEDALKTLLDEVRALRTALSPP